MVVDRNAGPWFKSKETSPDVTSLISEATMLAYEVRGPDLDGDYWIVEVDATGDQLLEISIAVTFPTWRSAQEAADTLNG
jgi:hypothetical protein